MAARTDSSGSVLEALLGPLGPQVLISPQHCTKSEALGSFHIQCVLCEHRTKLRAAGQRMRGSTPASSTATAGQRACTGAGAQMGVYRLQVLQGVLQN